MTQQINESFTVHPRKLIWNLKMMVTKRNVLFHGAPIFRFHVSFPHCNFSTFLLSDLKWRQKPEVLDPAGYSMIVLEVQQFSLYTTMNCSIIETSNKKCRCVFARLFALSAQSLNWTKAEGFEVSQCVCVCVCNIKFQSLRGFWKRMSPWKNKLSKTLLC